jgi:hypothetical protein
MNGGSPREPPLPRVAVGGMTTAGANSRHHDRGGVAPAARLSFGADLAHPDPERRAGRQPAQVGAAAGKGTFVTPVRKRRRTQWSNRSQTRDLAAGSISNTSTISNWNRRSSSRRTRRIHTSAVWRGRPLQARRFPSRRRLPESYPRSARPWSLVGVR